MLHFAALLNGMWQPANHLSRLLRLFTLSLAHGMQKGDRYRDSTRASALPSRDIVQPSFCERIVESVILFILFFMENGLTRYEIWVSERAFRLIFRRENFICMFSLFDFNKKSTTYDLVAFDLYPPWYSEKCVSIEIFNSIRIYVAIFRINIKNLAPDSRRRSWWIKNDACVESSWNMKLWRE